MTTAASRAPEVRGSFQAETGSGSRLIIWAGFAAVCLVYALPLLLSLAREGRILPVWRADEPIYIVRVAAAMRGDTLGNPYITGHDDAPKYLPEASERVVALAGRALHMDAVGIMAAFRIVQPAAVFLLVVAICRQLQLTPAMAVLAGFLATMAPSLTMLRLERAGLPGFLRYVRFLSPGFHTVVFLAACAVVLWCWRRPTWASALAAGLAVGAVFYVPIYYWSLLWAAVVGLALLSKGNQRRALLLAAVMGAVLAIPVAITSIHNSGNAIVQQTMYRWPTTVFLPGRQIEGGVLVRLAISLASAVLAWVLRRRSSAFLFLFPFFAASVPLYLQNLITNRQIQAYHFVNPLNPLWAILAAALLAQFRIPRFALAGALLVLVVAGAAEQAVDYLRLRAIVAKSPEAWALDWRMPHALAWLQQNTPADSVVLASLPVSELLPLFTHNKVYFADYAREHVMSDAEVDTRYAELHHWKPGVTLTYPMDYFLGMGDQCRQLPPAQVVFTDAREGTCVWRNKP